MEEIEIGLNGEKVEINEQSYNLPLSEDEYELSINLYESFLEFILKQKNIISNFYYKKELDLQTINNLFSTNFEQMQDALYFLKIPIKDKKVKLFHDVNRNIYSLIFKNIVDGNREVETKVEFDQKIQLTPNQIIFFLLDEVNSLKKKLNFKNEKSISELKDSKIEEFKKENNKKINENNTDTIKEFVKNMISGPINYDDNNKEQIDELVNIYGKEAMEKNEKNKSSFFYNIYNDKKRRFINSLEQILISETEKDIQKLKVIFDDKGFQSLDDNTLQFCLKTLKGKSNEEILKEIDALLALLKIQVSKEKKNKVIGTLNLLFKKEDIFNIAYSIFTFIDSANLSKGNFF